MPACIPDGANTSAAMAFVTPFVVGGEVTQALALFPYCGQRKSAFCPTAVTEDGKVIPDLNHVMRVVFPLHLLKEKKVVRSSWWTGT